MKIGRNELCPCGSGKKYKNCCLRKSSPHDSIEPYRYVVVFNGGSLTSAPLLLTNDMEELKRYNSDSMHLFDPQILPILPAVNFCLHLPRFEVDTYDVDTTILDVFSDVSHSILIRPSVLIESMPIPNILFPDPTLIIYADDCNTSLIKTLKQIPSVLGCISVSSLSESLLKEFWATLYEKRNRKQACALKELNNQQLLSDSQRLFLPALFSARQYNEAELIYQTIATSSTPFSDSLNAIWKQRTHHVALMNCKDIPAESITAALIDKQLEIARRKRILNVVITMPGIPNNQVKYGGLSPHLPDSEKNAIALIGLHRAIATNAILIELPNVNELMYKKLNELEINCQNNGTNNNYVLRSLRELGSLLSQMMTQEQISAIRLAHHISVFSDFPIGLAILQDDETSFHNYSQISYHPLSPLTRCFQLELENHPPLLLTQHFRVLFIECVPNNGEPGNASIRKVSESLLSSLKSIAARNKRMEVIFQEALSVITLEQLLKSYPEADILIISAHGHYDRESNMAGLMIGNDFWMANDLETDLPPIVITSACHSSPRGNGCVSVADLFLRAGAMAVLSTFIPIDAKRNTILLSRFFSCIADSQNNLEPHLTVLDCWTNIVATSIIMEFKQESSSFEKWIMSTNENGLLRLQDFENRWNSNPLKPIGHTYEETCRILKEMLHEEGLDGKFANLINREDYFPETSFYQWLGYPENVYIKTPK